MSTKPVLAIHGGAGNVARGDTPIVQQRLRSMSAILTAAYQALLNGSSALEAVMQAVIQLEDDVDFNAGRGSVLNAAGSVEMDAAIMDGMTQKAGAVASVRHIQNPIRAAHSIMTNTDALLLVGAGAEAYCQEHELPMQPADYFIVPARQTQWQAWQNHKQALPLDDLSLGTVGAVALDANGYLAAATSTGGKVNKLPGRVGDSPLIGSGTWADNNCAISATGDGEAMIRCAFAHEIAAQIRLRQLSLSQACAQGLAQLDAVGGQGGCIAIDHQGHVTLAFNTTGMYRGWVDNTGKITVAVLPSD